MRIVAQRVCNASVSINNEVHSAISKGFLLLVGVTQTDTQEDVEWLANKVCSLRVFDDEEGVMNKSIQDIDGEILAVSQFTLMASYKKGNRPSYIRASSPDHSLPLYNSFVDKLKQLLNKDIATGVFGADMKVSLINDGPVTICMDSKNKE